VSPPSLNAGELSRVILERAAGARRLTVAIAGPPGAGKSTLAQSLLETLNASKPGIAALMPMDGFHYDNAVLEPLGLMPRKGAPQTFDAAGFIAALARIHKGGADVAVPVFDRSIDLSRAGAAVISSASPIVLVEGNYLLLDADPWHATAQLFDLTVFLSVPREILEQRLVRRWLEHGLPREAARERALSNDIPNALLVMERSRPADYVLDNS
jgi:pantothenate kinase